MNRTCNTYIGCQYQLSGIYVDVYALCLDAGLNQNHNIVLAQRSVQLYAYMLQ